MEGNSVFGKFPPNDNRTQNASQNMASTVASIELAEEGRSPSSLVDKDETSTIRTSFRQLQDHKESESVQQCPVQKMLLENSEARTVRTSLDLTKNQEQVDLGPDGQIENGQIHDQDGQIQDQQQVGFTSHQAHEFFTLEYFRADGTRVVKTLNQRC